MGLGTRYKDPEKNRFAKTNLFFESNPYMLTQDPTVIGFRLMFDWTSPLLNIQDPDNKNTAHSYLLSIGETERAKYLKKFVTVLKYIDSEMSWYFQTIEGLDEAWKRDFMSPTKEGDITIGCLEDTTLKMTGLIDLYRKACFDYNTAREVVPSNLRKFDLFVYVLDGVLRPELKDDITVASLKKKFEELTVPSVDDIKDKFRNNNDLKLPIHDATRVIFNFHKCELNLESGSGLFSSLSNADFTTSGQSLKIGYRNVSESNLYTIFGSGDNYQNNEVIDAIRGGMDLKALDSNELGENLTFLADKAAQVLAANAKRIGRNLADKVETKAANLMLKTIGALLGNRKSLKNDTKDVDGILTTMVDSPSNNNTEQLGKGIGNGNTGSASLVNDTNSASGNVYPGANSNDLEEGMGSKPSGNVTSGASLANGTPHVTVPQPSESAPNEVNEGMDTPPSGNVYE
jgi:hypothetical protein